MRNFLLISLSLFLAIPAMAEWSRAGLFGADVRSLVIDESDPDLMFLGTSHGEIYASEDGGLTWTNPRGSLPFPGFVIDDLILDGRGRLWMGGWGVWGGGAVAVSDDGGVSWTRRDTGIDEVSIRAITVSPRDPDFLVAGGLTGVWKSPNAGRTWEKISSQENVESLAIDPRTNDTIFVGTWRQAWRTDDGGKKWKHIAEGMVLDTDVFSIDIDPKNPDDIWLSTCGWVYNSKNRGDEWTRYREGFENRRVHVTARDIENPSCVYAGSVAGLYRTLDGGKNWARISDDRMVINAIAIHPDEPDRIILGTEGDGIYISYDRGKTYHRHSRGLHNVRIGSVITDPRRPSTTYAVVRFAGSTSGIYASNDGGERWEMLNRTPLPEILSLIVREGEGPRFVAGTERGFFHSADGQDWERAEPTTLPIRVEKVLSYNSNRLFAATSDGVFTSRDGGRSWYQLGQPEKRILDIAMARHRGEPAIYALTAEGISRFTPEGWRAISGAPGGVKLVVVGKADEQRFLISKSKGLVAGEIDELDRWRGVDVSVPASATVHLVQGSGGLLFFATDEGRHLMMARSGETFAPTGLSLQATDVTFVAAHPDRPERIYVGTSDAGLFVFDPSGSAGAGSGGVHAGAGALEGRR